MRKRLIAAVLSTGISTAAALALTAPPAAAADSPTWCGSWLPDPAVASNQRTVPGTTGAVGPGQHIMVREGTYQGKWYAWAKLVNGGMTDLVALGWINQSNNQYYNCGSHDGSSGWAQRYYTAGVDDAHAYKVQAKYKHNAVQYGPAVVWR
ncbi:hypothetical protein ACIBCM_06400 [Streptomyces sp. NPDC051018]|uniref:hypothetical protein n=1 Tax=Streptomyces sp. NPDC051018 TaxID=3365639 RepID=UPI0037BD9D88